MSVLGLPFNLIHLQTMEHFVKDDHALDPYTLILLIGPTKEFRSPRIVRDHAVKNSIPLFYIISIGFYSLLTIQLPTSFPVVDTHPDPASTQDLRLLNPWPELLEFMKEKTQNLENLRDHDHGHIPYLLLLLHYLERWEASHDSNPPANYSEKKDFKTTLQRGERKNNAEGGEENFEEAAASVLKSLNPTTISSGLQAIFDAPECIHLSPDVSQSFTWILTGRAKMSI